MQDGAVWKLAGTEARLDFADLLAAIDLTRPELGLTGISYQGRPLDSTALLGVVAQRQIAPPIAEAYVRQRDLVVTYTQTPELPFRVQIYWRATSGPEGNPGVDLQVSVQTSLLDSSPRLKARTSLKATEVLRLDGGAAGEFKVFPPESGQAVRAEGQRAAKGCVLFRTVDDTTSYVEMIHPADESGGMLSAGGTSDEPRTTAGTMHFLFATSLEKGVILRARLRGVFLPRQRDTELAAEAYRQFLAAPPPLTT